MTGSNTTGAAYFNTPDGPIEREAVLASTDVTQLLKWHAGICGTRDEVKARVAAYTECGTADADADWLKRAAGKLAVCGAAARWVERRLLQLGEPLPVTLENSERQTVRTLHEKVHELKDRVDQLECALLDPTR